MTASSSGVPGTAFRRPGRRKARWAHAVMRGPPSILGAQSVRPDTAIDAGTKYLKKAWAVRDAARARAYTRERCGPPVRRIPPYAETQAYVQEGSFAARHEY